MLVQAELRRAIDWLTVFGFFDAGRARVNTLPWSGTADNTRQISGAGGGARWVNGPWSLESTVGWRLQGGLAQSEPRDRLPRIFLVLNYRFD